MDRIYRILRTAAPTLIAALMAGCSAYMAVRGLGFETGAWAVYALALAAAAIVQLGGRKGLWSLLAAVLLAGGFGLLLLRGGGEIVALVRDFAAKRGLNAEELASHIAAGRCIAYLAALALGSMFALGMKNGSSATLMIMLLLWALICAFAANEGMSLLLAAPGLIAGLAAFGLSAGGARESLRPAVLLPAAFAVLLALLLTPSERAAWEPLEDAAARLRSVVEDYVRFTEERTAFTINEKGYNRAELIGDSVVAMLGGPADPDEDAVMEVKTDSTLLLRGTIKRSYTGYSWIDDQVKARYLYYDFVHRGVRSAVFGADVGEKDPLFREVQGSVTLLSSGTSTLFVPARMADFDMELANAVYYNSAGEIFLTRDAQAGDSYSFTARVPVSDDALLAAAAAARSRSDSAYAQAAADYCALPEGIDSRVYALAAQITADAPTPEEKALAIRDYLIESYGYTLDGGYPPSGQDFVSWFLLEEKQGYCSYFASAMAVLCRINGIPARYVEGYLVKPSDGGAAVVTGENAHAWVEVYLNGLGWTPFDPTARTDEPQGGEAENADDPDDDGDTSDETPFENGDTVEDSADPTPTPAADDAAQGESEPTPTPDPGEEDALDEPFTEPDSDDLPDDDDGELPPEGGDDAQEPDQQTRKSHMWLWILLALVLLLLLALLAWYWGRRRLLTTDPLKLCVSTRSGQTAALILYRGVLDLLLQLGLAPQSGETPQQFAARAVQALPNPYYEVFVADVVRSRYSGKPLTRETLENGRRAYVRFLDGLRPIDRLRYHLRRMLRGLGDLESIP